MIKAIIIEDEEIAAIRLQNMIQEVDGSIVIQKIIQSVKQAIAYLSSNTPDLIFLDIHLSDSNSFEIFSQLDVHIPIIFTTAYSEYALKAFQQNSIDYLLKPVSMESLQQAIKKFKKYGASQVPDYKAIFSGEHHYKKRFLVKMSNALQSINVSDIAYFYSEDKMTFAKLKNGKYIPLDDTLNTLENQLDPNYFFRINRKYLTGIDSITRMYYASKSKIQIDLDPAPVEFNVFVSIEKIGKFKKWLSL
ncbi:LytR/AlgR family response regulator transcription factor [Zobellia roscoffensis]|uniref:LytR/AlgR family response regulator transcription factor n=1 Tax=Zobellia roscoffensis TaxID=2779508 RepID=UPI00188C46A9|nr:LytTR family DNA-binding domain-containing protein [Zobellia roscoffensis]